MKSAWIVFLLLGLTAPVWGQSADTAEPSAKFQSRKARDAGKTVPDGKADPRKRSGGNGIAAPGDVPAGTETKKAPEASKKSFIDENGDGLNDIPAPGAKRAQPAAGRPDGRAMDRFTDPDGDGINDGRGFERNKRDRGRNALEQNLKEKNRVREKNRK